MTQPLGRNRYYQNLPCTFLVIDIVIIMSLATYCVRLGLNGGRMIPKTTKMQTPLGSTFVALKWRGGTVKL